MKFKIRINQLLFLLFLITYFEILRIYEYGMFTQFEYRIEILFAKFPTLWFYNKIYLYFSVVFILNFFLDNLILNNIFSKRRSINFISYFLAYSLIIFTTLTFIADGNYAKFNSFRFLCAIFLFTLFRVLILDNFNFHLNVKTIFLVVFIYSLINIFFILNNTKETTPGVEFIFSEYNYFIQHRSQSSDLFDIRYYITCCTSDEYANTGAKPGGFLNSYKENIIIVSGSGEISRIKKPALNDKFFKRTKVNSNLFSLINKEEINNVDKISVRGVTIYKDEMYLSHIHEVRTDCYNVRLLKGLITGSEILFSEFFSSKECQFVENKISQALHSSSGAIVADDEYIYFAIGEFKNRLEAQDINSIFGKTIKINKKTGNHELLSLGHRNIQGMYKIGNRIYSSEHGPKGGDEVNEIIINDSLGELNYGWPISSYGEHYDGIYREKEPLHDSHADYGFIEPIFYFTPSIGISDVKQIDDYFIVSSMKEKKLYFVNNNQRGNVHDSNYINLEYRIRDFIIDSELIFLYLEDLPGFATIRINK